MRKISERQLAARRAREWFALDRVVAIFGSMRKLGAHFGISYQAVQAWYRNGVPFEHVYALERLTGGAVKCEELMEDFHVITDRPFQHVKHPAQIPRVGPAAGISLDWTAP